MNYLIWGTGSNTKAFLNEYWNVYFNSGTEHSILAFIDNKKEKVGQYFFNKKIISPLMIKNFVFDRIIICSTYEQEIKEQLINDIKIDKKVIMNQAQIEDEWYHNILEHILNKKFLIIGDKEIYKQMNIYTVLFNVSGFVDIRNLEEVLQYEYDYILLMDLMNILFLDRTIGKIELETQLIEVLSKQYNIDTKKILTNTAFLTIRNKDRKISLGNENIDKIFLVIRLGGITAGLGAILNKVSLNISYAKEKGYIPIIDLTDKNQYLEKDEIGKINAWEKFFEQPTKYKMQDIQKSKNIIITSTNNRPNLINTNNLSFLKMKPRLEREVIKYNDSLYGEGKKGLGVLFRGSDYANRKPYRHQIQPNLETMILKVKEKLLEWEKQTKFDFIYLCTEVEEAVKCFKKEFGNKLRFYPQKRVNQNYNGYLAEKKFERKDDAYHRGADYYIVLNALSKCNSLIAGACAGTTIALNLNNHQYEHVYIFNLGKYGIDDI